MNTTCPSCGYKATDHTDLTEHGAIPSKGDVSLCIECGEIAEFYNGVLRKLDIESLSKDIQLKLNKIKAAWRTVDDARRHGLD